jgi:uncharacterized membrane protein YbjE (DUF340 family)
MRRGYFSLAVIVLGTLAVIGDLAFLYGMIRDMLAGPGVGQ